MTGKIGVLCIQRDGISIALPSRPTVVRAQFSADTIKDLDIIKDEGPESFIKQVVEVNKIPSLHVIVVMSSNACLIKDFILPQPQAQKKDDKVLSGSPEEQSPEVMLEEAIKNYIAHAPFENVVTKRM